MTNPHKRIATIILILSLLFQLACFLGADSPQSASGTATKPAGCCKR